MSYAFNIFTGTFDLVTTGLTPGDITGGTPDTVAGFDAIGTLESVPNWGIARTTTGGANNNLSISPADTIGGETWFFYNYNSQFAPTTDIANLYIQNAAFNINLQSPFNVTTNIIGLHTSINTGDVGEKGTLLGFNNEVNLGDGTNVSTSQNSNNQSNDLEVRANHTANSVTAINTHVRVDGTVSQNTTGIYQSVELIGVSQNISGFDSNHQLRTGSSVQYVNSVVSNMTVEPGATITGNIAAFGIFDQVQAGAIMTNAGYTSLQINPAIRADMPNNGATAIGVFPVYSGAANSAAGITGNMQLESGAVITNGIEVLTMNAHMLAGSSANYMHSLGMFSQVDAGATLDSFEGINLNPNLNGTVGNIQLAQLGGNGASTGFVTGLNINLSTINSPNRKTAINTNGGVLNINSINTTTSNAPVDSLNTIVPTLQIEAGTPITGTTMIANNFSVLLDAEDDFTGGILGTTMIMLGLVGQVNVAAGKTVDTLSCGFAGFQLSGAGTLASVALYEAGGAVPGGGSSVISNLYGFKTGHLLTATSPTNIWGFHCDEVAAENFIKKSLAINTASEKVTASATGLEIFSKDLVLDGGAQYITAFTTPGIVTNDNTGKLISVPTLSSLSGRYSGPTSSVSGTLTTVVYATVTTDAAGNYDNTTGVFTCTVAGMYQFTAAVGTSGTFLPGGAVQLQIQQSGSSSQISEMIERADSSFPELDAHVTDLFVLQPGDTIQVQVLSTAVGPAFVSPNSRNFLSWFKVGA